MEFVKRKVAMETLNISYKTLYELAKNKEIETIKIGQNTQYNLNKYLRNKKINIKEKEKIAYCRVSSKKQKEDLDRQILFMKNHFPQHTIISDIGSGLNFKRVGLNNIIKKAINGEIEEVIIAYKDRLARFGFELIEMLIKKYSDGKIIIINKTEEITPTEELTQDIISIMNVYVAKINGLRKYKIQMKEEINKKYIKKRK